MKTPPLPPLLRRRGSLPPCPRENRAQDARCSQCYGRGIVPCYSFSVNTIDTSKIIPYI